MGDVEDEQLPLGEGEEELLNENEPKELQEQSPEEIEVESVLTEYDLDDFYSGAVNTLDSTIPLDLFEFEYSYGYNCHKYFNLCACDETVVCWTAGSIITFMDVDTKQTWFRRSTTGGSVGNITSYRKDPNYRIAIAEAREGDRDPLILLYTWPQMEIDAVLRDGTTNAYSIMDFSPDGELLASVGKEPDYNLTIWNWKRHKILLRTSAFTFDVNGVMFSPYCPGQLTTAGAAHIKFWKMAETFTGLKLKGELGRFGKTEICDVLGVYPMPDEKVLSGCDWGNILVWEAGLVKLEVTQRGRKSCHAAPIIQFMLSPAGDEVTTIARDGCVRAWYWDSVDQADPPEDDPFIELNPVAETCVPGCQIMCLKHQKDLLWYAQDGNGGIWVTEIDIDKIDCNHSKVMTCHAGGIVAMAALRTHPILITAGEDGAIIAYSTENNLLLAKYTFPTAVTCMLYPPIDLDETSRILMVGFADGIMRTLLLHPERLQNRTSMIDIRVHSNVTIHSEDSVNADIMDLISLVKPHSNAIHQISINAQRTLLVTCGEDSTIFLYKLIAGTPFRLERLGFITTPNNIAFMTWKPDEERVLLLCGQVGFIMEAVLPDVDVRDYSELSTFKLNFESYKEILVKKQFMRHRPFPEEEDLASLDEEALKAAAEVADQDDTEEEEWLGEIELMESESMLGTAITWAQYCDEGIWVVQKGTGCLLLVTPGTNKVLKYAPIPDAWCEDITVLHFICDGQYLIFGTNTGYIRMVRMPTDEEDNPDHHFIVWQQSLQKLLKKLKGRRLAKEENQPTPRIDFVDNYYLPMHDRYTGAITCLEFTSDGKRLFSCGLDGNIFSYTINFDQPLFPVPEFPRIRELPRVEKTKEPSTVEGEIMSHEQLKQKEEYDKMMAIANAHKKRVRDQLSQLTVEYNKIIKSNRMLPVSQQIDVTIDPRPLQVQERELEEAKALTKRKLAHQLEASDLALHKMYHRNIIQLDVFPFTLKAIRDPNVTIRPLRQKNLSDDFKAQLEEVHAKMAEAALKARRTEATARKTGYRKASWGPPRVASFLLGLPPKPPHPLRKAMKNYYQRLRRHHLQFIEWTEHQSRKPDPNAMPPGAAEALKDAEATIGNRLLKTHPEYVAPAGHNTQLRICLTRKEIYDNKRMFNEKLLELRQHKVHLVERMKTIGDRLAEIRAEIPSKLAKLPPLIPEIDNDLEFPEKNLEIKPEPMSKLMQLSRSGTPKKSTIAERQSSALGPQPRIKQAKVPRFVPITETHPLTATWDFLKPRPDMENTPIEIEIRERRIKRHLYEQDVLLEEANVAIEKFDSRLKELQRERIRVQEKNVLTELHLCQMLREMDVLNRFEAHEDRLAERVYSKLMQVRGVHDLIADCEHRILDHLTNIDTRTVECEEIQSRFKKLVQDNKFADFLRRIFKKKYRPPRTRDDDESSESEESSSSSEEEDEGSIDSRDIGPIRLDPNVCPEGCDREIYDKTFEMRNERHRYEQNILEENRFIELLRKDIEAHNKIKRKLSVQLDKRKNELREFMLEKQSRLNEVDQVVILRYDQIRVAALRNCTGPDGLSQAVVFPEKLLTRLRSRVLELQDEIKQQRLRQKINRTHLFRMDIDLRAMETEAEELRAQMRDVLTRKLGKPRKVDKTLDDVLRQMARRHKFSGTMGAMPQIHTQLREWKERHSTLEKKYLDSLRNYSERLRLAAALQADVLPVKVHKDPKVMPGGYKPEQYQRDVVRLRIVRAQQRQYIEAIKEEITGLRQMPLSEKSQPPSAPWSYADDDRIYLRLSPGIMRPKTTRYFPTTPLGSTAKAGTSVYDVNVTKLVFDCCDAMRVTRDDGDILLQELTAELEDVVAGTKTLFEVVDTLVKRWLLKYGGDPSQYKKQTKAFDALAALADRIMRQHVEAAEGATEESHQAMENLEEALRSVSDAQEPIHNRLGPALAALLATTPITELASEEAMTSLVNSLIDDDTTLNEEMIEKINIKDIIADIKDGGIQESDEGLSQLVLLAIGCLKAQLLEPLEAEQLDFEVERALSAKESTREEEAPLRTTRFQSVPELQTFAKEKAPSRADFYVPHDVVIDTAHGDRSSEVSDDEEFDEDEARTDKISSKSILSGKFSETTSSGGISKSFDQIAEKSSSKSLSSTQKSGSVGDEQVDEDDDSKEE